MVFFFFSVEKERNVKPVFGKGYRHRHRNGNSFICGAVKHGSFISDFFKIRLCVEFSEFSYLIARLYFSGVYKIGYLSSAFRGEIAEFKHSGVFKELNEFVFVTLHIFSPIL